MVDYSEDTDYAASRLNGSYVIYKNMPMYVRQCSADGVALNYPDGNHFNKWVPYNKIQTSGIKLGFANLTRGLAYITRIPTVYYKQGISSNNIGDYFSPKLVHFDDAGFINMIYGRYPSISQAIENRINNSSKVISAGVAFSRKYAIGVPRKTYCNLLGKFGEVGRIYLSDFNMVRFELNDDSSFLQEDVEEVISNVKV